MEESGSCKKPLMENILDPRKNHRYEIPDHEDRISNLPDSILCHILSFLPTKDAAVTTLLSNQWRHIFPSVPNLKLHFDQTKFNNNSDNYMFDKFVETTLNAVVQASTSVDELALRFHWTDVQDVLLSYILNAASRLNVPSLHLFTSEVRLKPSTFYLDFFNTLGHCTQLSSLTIDMKRFRMSFVQFFPKNNLKVLDLRHVILEESSASNLFSCCPVLEKLVMIACNLQNNSSLSICVPTLKHLTIDDCFSHSRYRDIIMDVPMLQELSLQIYGRRFLDVSGTTKINMLRDASLNIYGTTDPTLKISMDELHLVNAAEFVERCSETKRLTLSSSTLAAVLFSGRRLISFPNLEQLSLELMYPVSWQLLAPLLARAPNLSFIKIDMVRYHFYRTDRENFRLGPLVDIEGVVPECFPNLRKVSFSTVLLGNQLRAMVNYFLKKAESLENMTVYFTNYSFERPDQLKIETHLQMLPLWSQNICHVVFN